MLLNTANNAMPAPKTSIFHSMCNARTRLLWDKIMPNCLYFTELCPTSQYRHVWQTELCRHLQGYNVQLHNEDFVWRIWVSLKHHSVISFNNTITRKKTKESVLTAHEEISSSQVFGHSTSVYISPQCTPLSLTAFKSHVTQHNEQWMWCTPECDSHCALYSTAHCTRIRSWKIKIWQHRYSNHFELSVNSQEENIHPQPYLNNQIQANQVKE